MGDQGLTKAFRNIPGVDLIEVDALNRKIVKSKKTKANPLKNIRAMLKINPYAAVMKKNAELLAAKNVRAKEALVAKKTGKPVAADPMAKRNAKAKKTKKAAKK